MMDLLYQQRVFSDLDIQFARLMERLSERNMPELSLAAALASRYRGDGHVCVDLARLAGAPLPLEGADGAVCPNLPEWLSILAGSAAVGKPGDYRPLILDGSRLYLYRYWDYEQKLAENLTRRAAVDCGGLDEGRLRDGVARLFPAQGEGQDRGVDWQKVAAFAALLKGLCVISGGPGTGKTFTVAKILALLIEQPRDAPLRIALTAPTGKAAARLQEAIRAAREALPCDEAVRAAIPAEASTIHRLLGSVIHSPYFRYNAGNPLPVDAVVVDEASMVDLALFSKLAQAVPPQARLILLGDKDQLASVEAGAILGDICDTGTLHGYSDAFGMACRQITAEEIPKPRDIQGRGGIGDCLVALRKSYRFSETSGIRAVSRAVNDGNGKEALDILKGGAHKDAAWRDLPGPEGLMHALEGLIEAGFAGYGRAVEPAAAFEGFSRFRILCALREGPYGARTLNGLVEQVLHRKGIIRREGRWYPGRPVMMMRNDYSLRLFNGDVGIALPDPEADRELRVFFPTTEGLFRKFPPLRLPEHETVYAMTVHKSQGSEFDRVLFLMPDRPSPVLTRELIYTAATRAREGIEVWGRDPVFLAACSRRVARSSGLREALWG